MAKHMLLWSMHRGISSALRNNACQHRALYLAIVLCLGMQPAAAQNNTGYPSGTKCQDLQEPRRSACRDAFDPRPNPQETINKPAIKPILPRNPPALDQAVPRLNPKSQLESVPPPLPKVQFPDF
jgi:hypothetical protein